MKATLMLIHWVVVKNRHGKFKLHITYIFLSRVGNGVNTILMLVPLFQYQIRDCPSPCFVSSTTLRQTPCVNNLWTKTWRIDPWRKQSYSTARNRQFCSNEKMTVNKTSMRTLNKHCRSEIFVCVVSTAIDGDSASSVKFSTQVKCVF